MNTPTRRQFLQATAATLLAAPVARAIEPLGRTGKARLLLSLAAYSFREYFTGELQRGAGKAVPAGQAMDMFKFIDFCAAHGCEGTELTSYFFPKALATDYLVQIRRHAFVKGVAISGTAIGNNFSHPKGEKRDAEIALTKQWIDRAAVLGTSHVRVFAGQTKELSREDADKLVIAALEECSDYAGQKGIFLGIENHDAIGSAEHLLKLIKQVNSRWLGVNLDSGNFRTENPYDDFEKIAPYAVNVQMKTEIHRLGAKESEPADLARKVKILRDARYQGYIALEFEAKANPYEAVPPVLKRMKELFAA
ncbi:MAG: sugar phosphate isomerase/epimerase [Verrucomicrobia bacterium]|nr:sugar phosphate isomerase/epimerase [Verrucomicrobiota bacterium]NBU07418.1 sugar phosphate isomerase/epimerase [Pseudomonadota bacterium]NDA66296.1 sugar phosphate isomerase/epimerase [Verrucomicrobiota bacterium]NDB75147.1 sugar phosphate isomerase/epimerase [Verrucomicrobiota bacterium]NDD38195.1 sugar phosphate isomerase/epimerase [Verrucomicrobiota bacterium]